MSAPATTEGFTRSYSVYDLQRKTRRARAAVRQRAGRLENRPEKLGRRREGEEERRRRLEEREEREEETRRQEGERMRREEEDILEGSYLHAGRAIRQDRRSYATAIEGEVLDPVPGIAQPSFAAAAARKISVAAGAPPSGIAEPGIAVVETSCLKRFFARFKRLFSRRK